LWRTLQRAAATLLSPCPGHARRSAIDTIVVLAGEMQHAEACATNREGSEDW
jgi:hypothetical protein